MRLIQFAFTFLHHSALMAIYWNTYTLVGGAYLTIKLAFVPYHHFLNLEVLALGQNKAAASSN